LIKVITKGETPLWRGDTYQEKGMPFLKVQNISQEGIHGELTHISKSVHDRMKRSKLYGGEILYTMAGSIGVATIFPEGRGDANINQAIAKIVVKEEINKKYLIVILNSNLCALQSKRMLTTSAQPNINFEQIKSLKIPLPPHQTQNRIAQLMDNAYEIKKQKESEAQQLIDSIDDYILSELGIKLPELKDEMCYIVTADEVKNNRCDAHYYQPKFTLAESKLEAVDCSVFSLGELITDLSGGATPKVEGDFYTDIDGVFFLRVQNISMEGIILEDVKFIKREVHEGMLKRSQLNKNDLVYTITGRIGSVAVVPEGFEGNINQHSVRFHLKEKINNMDINPHYVAIFLNTELGNFLAIRKATGGTRPALDYHALKSLIIPHPSEEIQAKIAKEVKARMQKSEQLQKEAKEVLEEAKKRVERIILGEEEI